MFVSASTSCFAELPFDQACQQIADLDYDHVEIWMTTEGEHLTPPEVADNPDAFVSRFRKLSRLTPCGLYLEQDVPLETFEGLIKTAKLLRVAQITIPASPLGTPFNTEIDRLRALTLAAGESGIRVSVKTKTGHLTEDPRTAVELCQAVRGLGVTLDPSHYICGPHGSQSFEIVFPHVFHAHLRDTSADQLQVPAGLGEMDFARLISSLKQQNFNQALSVELIPALFDNQQRPLELRKLRMLLETLL